MNATKKKKKNLDVKSDTVFPSSQQLSFGTRKVSARAQQDTERGREKNKKKNKEEESAPRQSAM